MVNATFEEIPTPEAVEYDGDLPSAFACLPAFLPPNVELCNLRQDPAQPTLGNRLLALWAQPGATPPATATPCGTDPEVKAFQARGEGC